MNKLIYFFIFKEKNLDFSSADKVVDLDEKNEQYDIPKYKKNPKLKENNNEKKKNFLDSSDDESKDSAENPDCDLEDLMNLLEQEDNPNDDVQEKDDEERKKIFIRKEKNLTKSPVKANKDEEEKEETKSTPKCVSSITITRIPKETNSNQTDNNILTEKNTGIRLIKSAFKNDIDLNMRLACDFGKFLKLTDINRRAHELKESKELKWYSVFLLMSKTESKCSANGNNYVIWKLTDVNNIDKQQDISLFLFGNAYKSHWKSNEFEVFALIQPDILDSNKSNNQQQSVNSTNSNNSYYSGNSPSFFVNNGKKAASSNSNWNKFAAKKVDLNNKLSLSVKSDHQLISLGFSKDITVCQSFKSNSESNQIRGENSKQCKNLVNLQESPFCIYHCKQLDNKNKFAGVVKNKYSMNEPKINRLGSTSLFESTLAKSPDVTFMPNNDMLRNKLLMKAVEMETKVKVSKEIKSEILNSLNASIKDSPLMAQIGAKTTTKKSDLEILASLDGKQLDKEEINKIRLAEQATVRHYSSVDNSAQKEISKIFKSKILLPSEATCNNSISSKRLHEYKQSQTTALSTNKETGAVIKLSPFDYSAKLKEKYDENKKNYNLSTMSSHKDILKQIKDKDEKKAKMSKDDVELVVEEKVVASPLPRVNKSIIAADFLAKRMNEIKNSATINKKEEKKPLQNNNTGFDLELYIGDSLTTKKLLDAESKYIGFSPSTATSAGYKRKLEELKKNDSPKSSSATKPPQTPEDKKAKKLKMIDEILSIKSNHLKEVNDPDKNPHLKSYFNKLELQESVDNKLCSVRNREIRAVTCKICSYTSFSQSDYCKKQNHVVTRHMAIQRYFKCKICNKRTYTIDKM